MRTCIDRVMRPLHRRLVCLLRRWRSRAAQQRPSGALTPQIESVLQAIKAADKGQLAVSEEDGRFLRVLVATRGAKSILEIGAASGYSGIWLGLGARETGRPRRRHRVRPAAREGSGRQHPHAPA